MNAAKQGAPIGVYVHFPWCLAKCPYCDFLSVAAERPAIPHERYADAVTAELARRRTALGPRRLRSVFFGGGTPSLWEPRQLGRVLAAIREAFPSDAGDPDPEISVECNPSSLDRARAEALLGVGANRLSIGVQGLDAERLRFLGRLHDPERALGAVKDALAAGAARVSADLIFGVAGQAPAQAAAEVLAVAALGVGHVSAYALTIEPGTLFGALAANGRLPLLPDDTVAEAFLAVDAALTGAGFEHYEISNYARPGERARHNLGYWSGDDYLGLGCGAWGTVTTASGRLRYRNTPAPERYTASADAWRDAELDTVQPGGLVANVEPIDAETALRERLMLGLRLREGFDLERAAGELGVEAWPRSRARAADRLVDRGRLEREAGVLRIPQQAWLLADATIGELL